MALKTFKCHYSGPMQSVLLSGHSLSSSRVLPTPSSCLMPGCWTEANPISNSITAIASQTSLPRMLLKRVAENLHFNLRQFRQAADLARDCMWKHTWALGPSRQQLWQQPGSAGGARASQGLHSPSSLARCRQNHWRPQLKLLSSPNQPHHSLQSGQTSPMCYKLLSYILFQFSVPVSAVHCIHKTFLGICHSDITAVPATDICQYLQTSPKR